MCVSCQTLGNKSEESAGPQLAGFLTLPPASGVPSRCPPMTQQLSSVYCIT